MKGPSIMPGGSAAAWQHVEPIFKSIAAKVDDGAENGISCEKISRRKPPGEA